MSDSPPTARDLLVKLERVLGQLDVKIDHSLHVGTIEQMRADLAYIRGLIGEATTAIRDELGA